MPDCQTVAVHTAPVFLNTTCEEHALLQVRVSAQQAQKNVKQSAAQLRGKAGKATAPTESEKKGGPLSWLGFSQETVYVDDD